MLGLGLGLGLWTDIAANHRELAINLSLQYAKRHLRWQHWHRQRWHLKQY